METEDAKAVIEDIKTIWKKLNNTDNVMLNMGKDILDLHKRVNGAEAQLQNMKSRIYDNEIVMRGYIDTLKAQTDCINKIVAGHDQILLKLKELG